MTANLSPGMLYGSISGIERWRDAQGGGGLSEDNSIFGPDVCFKFSKYASFFSLHGIFAADAADVKEAL